MKHKLVTKLLVALFISVSIFSCNNDKDSDDGRITLRDHTEILKTFTDKTVVPTLTNLKNYAKIMYAKVEIFNTTPTEENLVEISKAWKTTRQQWERSEAFLFGPADVRSLDPKLDSWPLDRTQLKGLLKSELKLESANLPPALRGFHAIEFIVFDKGEVKKTVNLTPREREYLNATALALRNDCIELWARWTGGAGEEAIIEKNELEVPKPYYRTKFLNSGKIGGSHVSHDAAVDQMLQGMIAIADEVGKAKISDPVSSNDPLKVESWFSYNSRLDFMNNIESIRNCYLGGIDNKTRGNSISDYIKKKDAKLDTKVLKDITNCIAAIKAIPQPFRDNLKDKQCKVAMAACLTLQNSLESIRKYFVE